MMRIRAYMIAFLVLSGTVACFDAGSLSSQEQLGQPTPSEEQFNGDPIDIREIELCEEIPASDRINAQTQNPYEFYNLAEDVSRFTLDHDEKVYVVGDIHGSWEIIAKVLLNSGLMKLESQPTKEVSTVYNGQPKKVTIPNLKFTSTLNNKVIFIGDYIAKLSEIRGQKTLALLKDILAKQAALARSEPAVVAILGNHDLEAVNGVNHGGYSIEKNYKDEVMSMINSDMLLASYYYNGIWYSHSYLTPTDMRHFQANGINFYANIDLAVLSPLLNQRVNEWIKNSTLQSMWLASPVKGADANFFYVMGGPAADGNDGNGLGTYEKFPMIMGHLSDPLRQVHRVLVEGPGGKIQDKFKRREHILCVDTSIYNKFKSTAPARVSYLKINYNKSSTQRVKFQTCSVSNKYE